MIVRCKYPLNHLGTMYVSRIDNCAFDGDVGGGRFASLLATLFLQQVAAAAANANAASTD